MESEDLRKDVEQLKIAQATEVATTAGARQRWQQLRPVPRQRWQRPRPASCRPSSSAV